LKQDRPPASLALTALRVPAVAVAFWITKGLTTGMGESSSDFLVHRLPPVVAVALGGIALAAALALQFAARRYVPWIYWLAVAMVGVFGTMAADVLHVGLGVPYFVSTAFFAVSLVVVFAAWYGCEKTLSIHSIYTTRREAFYWAAVMTTFALGTAAGDLTAVTLHLGYFASGVMFASSLRFPQWPIGGCVWARSRPSGSPTSRLGRSGPRSRTGWAYPTPGAASTWAPVRSAWL
jgi:uncharacterized membrane-anchored protein